MREFDASRLSMATLNHSPLFESIDGTGIEEQLDALSEAGFESISPDVFWLRTIDVEGLGQSLRARGMGCMEIAGIAIGSEETTTPELEENLRYAEALGAEFVNARVVAPPGGEVDEQVRRVTSSFGRVGTQVALEFSRGTELGGVAETRALIERIGDGGFGKGRIGVTLDTWHFFLHPDGPAWEDLEALPLELIANVQLSDGVDYEEGAFREATMDRRRLPGEGDFDLARFFACLEAKSHSIPIIVEVLNAEERERPLAEFARRVMEASKRFV